MLNYQSLKKRVWTIGFFLLMRIRRLLLFATINKQYTDVIGHGKRATSDLSQWNLDARVPTNCGSIVRNINNHNNRLTSTHIVHSRSKLGMAVLRLIHNREFINEIYPAGNWNRDLYDQRVSLSGLDSNTTDTVDYWMLTWICKSEQYLIFIFKINKFKKNIGITNKIDWIHKPLSLGKVRYPGSWQHCPAVCTGWFFVPGKLQLFGQIWVHLLTRSRNNLFSVINYF